MFRNPDLAETYQKLASHGPDYLYQGALGQQIANTVQHPPVYPGSTFVVRPGVMTAADVANYTAKLRQPTHVQYRGLDVYGMAPPSSGGITVGEALNILSSWNLSAEPRAQALFQYLEASRLAFADRNAYIGDSDYQPVPQAGLLDPAYAATRQLPDQEHRADLAGRARQPVPAVWQLHREHRQPEPGARGRLDQPPGGRRQVGQRGQLHQHHRADRR